MPLTTYNPFVVTESYEFNKKALKVLSIVYIGIGIVLIAVGWWARASARISSDSISGGVTASGVFLCAVSVLGYHGAQRHHVGMLFYYMIIMTLIALMQFVVACVTLSYNDDESRRAIVEGGWAESSASTKDDVQRELTCCGLFDVKDAPPLDPGPTCPGDTFASGTVCYPYLASSLGTILLVTGLVALFMSLLQTFGIYAAYRFRKQKNPKANPEAFLL